MVRQRARRGQHRTPEELAALSLPRLAGAFLAWLLVLSVLVSLLINNTMLVQRGLAPFIAMVSAWLLNLLGIPARLSGVQIQSPTFAANIVDACTGLLPMTVFAAGVLAYPASPKTRLVGLLAGASAIFVVNLVRVVSLFWIGVHWRAAFDIAHFLVWQTAIIIFVLILMWGWVERLADAPAR